MGSNSITVSWCTFGHLMQSKYRSATGLSTEERSLLDQLAADERATIDVQAVMSIRGAKSSVARQALARLHAKGWLVRLRRGLYAPVALGDSGPAVNDPWVLAMDLFPPCFISGWSAAEHWDLTEQIFNSVSVVTSSAQRKADQTFAGMTYRVRSLPEKRFFGQRDHWAGSHKVSLADPSRTIVDILDAPDFGGGGRHAVDVVLAYWRSEHADPDALLDYVRRYERGTLAKRVGFLAERAVAEQTGVVTKQWLSDCHRLITKGVSSLDPAGSKSGPVDRRWNLRINVPLPPQSRPSQGRANQQGSGQ